MRKPWSISTTVRNPERIREFLKVLKMIEGDVWTVIDATNLTVLIIQSQNYNRKSYRNKINSNLKELVGTKIIFFTDDFNDYNLTLIFDGIFNIKFNPSL